MIIRVIRAIMIIRTIRDIIRMNINIHERCQLHSPDRVTQGVLSDKWSGELIKNEK